MTGSFFAATPEGINPARKVSTTLISTRNTAPSTGRDELIAMIPVRSWTMMLMGIFSKTVTRMPMSPAASPTMKVSALKTREMSRFDAPMARRIPVSYTHLTLPTNREV